MTLIKLNDGESVTIQMNHDKDKNPYSITIMRRGDWMGTREFNKRATASAIRKKTYKPKL